MDEYKNYMQSPQWDAVRKARLKKDRHTCQGCGETNKPLDVHHETYARFGHERLDDLKSLCRACHEIEHGERPHLTFGTCQTCGRFLLLAVEKLKIFNTVWMQITCADGHIRSQRQ